VGAIAEERRSGTRWQVGCVRWAQWSDAWLSVGTTWHRARGAALPSGTKLGKSEATSGSSCSFSRVASCARLGLESGSAAMELWLG
jgi:hypothetical protein